MGLILCVVGLIVVVSAILFGYWLSQKNFVKSKNTWQNWDIKIGKA
jgi:FtsZ-interacting cell division protein ZipA